MSDSLGLKVVNRVEKTDRLPFIKAMAHIATADDTVDLNEKEMVEDYTEAWELDEDGKSQVQSILNAKQKMSLDELTSGFSESGTRFLLMQELMRLSYADGTYGNAERKEIAAIAQRMGMSERQFREVEKWVGRGQAWEATSDDEEHEDALEDVIEQEEEEEEEEDEYDLSDIETSDSDLADIDPGGYEIDEDELEELDDEMAEEDDKGEKEATEEDDEGEEDTAEEDDEGGEEEEDEPSKENA